MTSLVFRSMPDFAHGLIAATLAIAVPPGLPRMSSSRLRNTRRHAEHERQPAAPNLGRPGLQQAIRLLRQTGFDDAAALDEWVASGDQAAREPTASDGIG